MVVLSIIGSDVVLAHESKLDLRLGEPSLKNVGATPLRRSAPGFVPSATREGGAVPDARTSPAPHGHAGATETMPSCARSAGFRYGIAPSLLMAIADVESGLRAHAVGYDGYLSTDTYDIGLMGINSSWLPKLKQFGIDEADLYDPCTNLAVGAWILSLNMREHGSTWKAVGAFNASCNRLTPQRCVEVRNRYIERVWRSYARSANVSARAAISTERTNDVTGFE